jgi:phosphoglycerol transferase MdoB-like AlkP superfamily enzyme
MPAASRRAPVTLNVRSATEGDPDSMKSMSNILLLGSLSVILATLALPGSPPHWMDWHGTHNWFQCPLLWWLSILLLLSAIAFRWAKKEKPYPFAIMLVLFFVQTFFALGPKSGFVLLLILAFTVIYQLLIVKGHGTNMKTSQKEN